MKCVKCREDVPKARLRALPGTKTCVECSDVERNYVRTIISGKTTYSEIEVIKNKDTKEYLKRLDAKGRTGFGSSLYRASKNNPGPKASELSTRPRVARKLPEFTRANFENVLQEAMLWLDDKPYAIKKVESAYKDEVISGIQRRQIIEILDTFNPTSIDKVKEIKSEPVDSEILYAFKNWKH
tara:strand:+ start:856 stop:1404 length:549 start_codon:yes stop_codon:yes gene_type:complete